MSSPVAGTSTGFRSTRAHMVLSSSSPAEGDLHLNGAKERYFNSPLPSPIPGTSTGKARRYLNMSPRRITFLRKKSQSTHQSSLEEIEENDDDAERLARRGLDQNNNSSLNLSSSLDQNNNSSLNVSSNSTSNPNLSLSCEEVKKHISKCLKLSAQNKINNQNAFQLKMIDFLVYSLKKQNPEIDLNVATAYLDVSKSIYACRVDSVHSDLLKVIGVSQSGKRKHDDGDRDHEAHCDDSSREHDSPMKKRRKRKNVNIIANIEELRKDVNTYHPQFPIQVERDALTSDMLMQLCSQPVHQNVALSYTDGVTLDRMPCNRPPLKMKVATIDNFSGDKLCHYAHFSFHREWPLDCGFEENDNLDSSSVAVSGTRNSNENSFHSENSNEFGESMVAHNNDEVANFEAVIENTNQNADISDFVDEISNNPNRNLSCEYSHLRQKYIRWSGPAYWKFISTKRTLENQEVCNLAKRRKKEINLDFTDTDWKNEIAFQFIESKRSKRLTDEFIMRNWRDEKISNTATPLDSSCRNLLRFFNKHSPDTYTFQKDVENRLCSESVVNMNAVVEQPYHNGEFLVNEDSDDMHVSCMGNEEPISENSLVGLPKRVDVVPIAHVLRPKKVCMRELKQVIRMLLNVLQQDGSSDSNVKLLSDLYKQLPHHLSRANVASMSPALVFVSLMHVVNEDQISAFSIDDLSDILVQKKA